MHREQLKTYLYVSDTKVDWLYEQVDPRLQARLTHDLRLDAKMLTYSVTMSPQPEKTRAGRLAVVLKSLDQQGAGTVESPLEFFRGNMLMKEGRYPETLAGALTVAFFTGCNEDGRLVALGGSAHHLRGMVKDQPWSNSGMATLLAALAASSLSRKPEPVRIEDRLPGVWFYEAREAWEKNQTPPRRLEFMAEKIIHGGAAGCDVILGSPVYVAVAPDPRPEPPRRRWWR